MGGFAECCDGDQDAAPSRGAARRARLAGSRNQMLIETDALLKIHPVVLLVEIGLLAVRKRVCAGLLICMLSIADLLIGMPSIDLLIGMVSQHRTVTFLWQVILIPFWHVALVSFF